ncbi:Fucolectin-3 Precursor [Takifugu flavidus]|uniref:Fucolectin-3 n=1 Tax=Takifugu flavidus TaxID=433684 RepID=A0A5C6N8K0_9TELE|nr:Fucolectin-3 Precursor [Takifugu flavidus]
MFAHLGIFFFLLPGVLAGHVVRNVALKSPAVQSSEKDAAAAGRAVDGNRDPAERSTCTLTQSESGPWWRVDLQDEYKIDAVAITSVDDKKTNLDGVEIWIGISERLNDINNIRCTVISRFPKKRTLYVPCSGFEGRYVTVLLPGASRVLSLCEVEVYPVHFAYPLPNVALKGKASQSSTLSFSDASKAIDGRRNSFYGSGYCSHTAGDETDPWWRVDLQKKFIITTVKVTNRGDCCHERLDGAEIRIGNEPRNNGNNNSRCALITRIGPGKTSTFHCEQGSMAGRFVNILIPGKRKTLTLCEVEVYGAPEERPLQNVALKKPVKWSLQTQYHTSSASVNGCRNVNSADCCTAELFKHWWKVDLLAVYKIKAITIINVQEDFKETNIYIRNPGANLDDDLYALATLAPSSESVVLNGRTMTMVGERLCWSDAVLYCRRHHWDLLSLHSKEEQAEAVRLLSRATFVITDGVWLGLRRYMTSETWFWMSGDSMIFSQWPHHSVPHQYSSPCGSMDVGAPHQWVDRSCGQHLNFICQSGSGFGSQRVPFNSYGRADTG